MGIVRYSASLDTTITNAYQMNLITRATGANMGLTDTLETFSIYGQATTASSELSRILIQFPIDKFDTDRSASVIPASGSVNFFLRMYNAEHTFTLPKNFNLNIAAVAKKWQEGYGLDADEYKDLSYDDDGANWINARKPAGATTVAWNNEGGDIISDTSSSFTASFENGTEDIEVNITTLVEQWMGSAGNVLGSKTNYGVLVGYPSAQESATRSYYTKKFFARSSQYYLKRPTIEARWDSSKKDSSGDFFLSSSLATGTENLNTIYLYNNIRGQLRNIPVPIGTGKIYVSIYSGSSGSPSGNKLYLPFGGDVVANSDINITGGWTATGIYSASFAYASSSITEVYPVWHHRASVAAGGAEYHTGSAITVKTFDSDDYNPHPSYASTITNLRDTYSRGEKTTRFRLYVRQKDWNPNIYVKASREVIPSEIIENAYYKVYRTIDEFEVAGYGTGSTNHTRLSYDASGSYFDFPMDILEAGYMYAFKFTYKMPDGNYREQPETFKFRVD